MYTRLALLRALGYLAIYKCSSLFSSFFFFIILCQYIKSFRYLYHSVCSHAWVLILSPSLVTQIFNNLVTKITYPHRARATSLFLLHRGFGVLFMLIFVNMLISFPQSHIMFLLYHCCFCKLQILKITSLIHLEKIKNRITQKQPTKYHMPGTVPFIRAKLMKTGLLGLERSKIIIAEICLHTWPLSPRSVHLDLSGEALTWIDFHPEYFQE